MKNRKYVIVDSRRFFAFMTFVFILIALTITMIFTLQTAHGNIESQSYKEYHVLKGDNLWNISLEYMPKDYDVRKMIFDIKKLNGMDDSYLAAGETIKIPLYSQAGE